MLGRPVRHVSTGSTEPREILEDIAAAIGVQDRRLPKPQFAEQLAHALGQVWDPSCDSRSAPSGGGSTVTLVGLQRLREGVRGWIGPGARPPSHAAGDDAAAVTPDIELAPFTLVSDSNLRPDLYEMGGNAALERVFQEEDEGAHSAHRRTLNLLASTLRAAGAECWEDRASVDLVASWVDSLSVLFEVTTIPEDAVGPTRLAVSKVLEYAYRLRRRFSEPVLCIVYDRQPHGPSWLLPYLCEDRRINVIWLDAGALWIQGPEARLLAARVPGVSAA